MTLAAFIIGYICAVPLMIRQERRHKRELESQSALFGGLLKSHGVTP